MRITTGGQGYYLAKHFKDLASKFEGKHVARTLATAVPVRETKPPEKVPDTEPTPIQKELHHHPVRLPPEYAEYSGGPLAAPLHAEAQGSETYEECHCASEKKHPVYSDFGPPQFAGEDSEVSSVTSSKTKALA